MLLCTITLLKSGKGEIRWRLLASVGRLVFFRRLPRPPLASGSSARAAQQQQQSGGAITQHDATADFKSDDLATLLSLFFG